MAGLSVSWMAVGPEFGCGCLGPFRKDSADIGNAEVLALFTVGDVYASLCKRGAYAPFSA